MKNSPTTVNAGPVFRAGLAPSISIAQGAAMPQVRGTIAGWFKPMVFGVVDESITADGPRDGQAVATVRTVKTSGVFIPDEEELEVKPEGQRSWATWFLYVYRQLDVKTDTRILVTGPFAGHRVEDVPFRVMKKKDFKANGYIRYVVQEDYDRA